MIEYALLIMLGFCVGGLIALLLAPTLWQRAVRLTTKRLESTMPMSLSDIEADKDLLRASYAITIRRLESSLSKARDKSANQLVDISRLQMRIGELGNQISALELQLDERRNAATVFENTIRKRFPELENMVAAAKAALDDRTQEINDLTNTLRRREEALAMAQRATTLQQQEILKLRETLEQRGADVTGRFKRRPSQWTLEEYRSEYDRLNVELSKMREHLILSQEREASQISVLKTELQRLGERIMASVAAHEVQPVPAPRAEPERKTWPSPTPEPAQSAAMRRGLGSRPAARAQPWPGETAKDERPAAPTPPSAPAQSAPRSTSSTRRWTQSAVSPSPNMADRGLPHSSRAADRHEAPSSEAEKLALDALQTLLSRSPRPSGKDNLFEPAGDGPPATDAVEQAQKAALQIGDEPALNGQHPPDDQGDTEGGAGRPSTTAPAVEATSGDTDVEPKLDKVFQEIFESRSGALGHTAAAAPVTESRASQMAAAERQDAPALETAEVGAPAGSGSSNKTRTLLDRLRVMQERQTG
ncbi:MAG TPA: hypothetical protein VH858_03285 [Hyphomicrobiales bacterium]